MGLGICIKTNKSIKAVNKYLKAFDLTLGYHVLNDDGTYFHSELYLNDEEIFDVVQINESFGNSPIQLAFIFDTKEKLEKAFDILKENGKIIMEISELPWSPYAAEVIDEFNINWFLTLPMHQPDSSFKPK